MKANLWDPEYLNTTYADRPEILTSHARKFFPNFPNTDIETIANSLREELRPAFLRMAAAAWLLSNMGRSPSNRNLPTCLRNISPFNRPSVRMEQLGVAEWTAACFPLTGPESPQVGQVWAIRRNNKIESAFSAPEEWIGQSYELAQAMAKKALDASIEIKNNLARDWIMTGRVHQDGNLGGVESGNKFDKPFPCSSADLTENKSRSWLVPDVMRTQIPPSTSAYRIRFSRSVDDAWRIICGDSIPAGGLLPWPEVPVHYHTFVSGALAPAAALAFSIPSPIASCTLWTSEKFQQHAELLSKAMKHFRPELSPEIISIDSNHLSTIEGTLLSPANPLNGQLSRDEPVLFNITQGNRLMPIAVHDIARLNDRLWLVYRNIDDKVPWHFDCLVHDSIPPTIYHLSRENPPELNSQKLFTKAPKIELKVTLDELIAEWSAQ